MATVRAHRQAAASVHCLHRFHSLFSAPPASSACMDSAMVQRVSVGVPRKSSFFFPHPLVAGLRSHAGWKTLLPFTLALTVLFTYVGLDQRLPAGQSYAALEFAGTAEKLQLYLDTFSRSQYAVVGISVGLHLFNAVVYAVTLATVSAFCSLHLRAGGHTRWARVADIVCWLQPLTWILYTCQHGLLFSQFAQGRAERGVPEATMAFGIAFLTHIVACVLFVLCTLVWLTIYRCKNGATPLQQEFRAEASSSNHRSNDLPGAAAGAAAGSAKKTDESETAPASAFQEPDAIAAAADIEAIKRIA